ncbi:MAG: CHAT domain-containing protein, partial [Pyrinomonadaceae bacterium]
MNNIPPTLTLEIGELNKAKYPLRLIFNGRKNPEERARAEITKKELESPRLKNPVETFLAEAERSEIFQELGQYFYGLLHQGDVAKEWDRLKAKHERLRVQLDIKAKEVSSFPWELICDDNLERLAANPAQTFVRKYQPAKPISEFKPDSWPLRVLIVIGAREDDADVLPLKELRRVELEINNHNRKQAENYLVHRMIDIEVLPCPNLEQLENSYKEFKPHIFHFIGHGQLRGKNSAQLLINHLDSENKYHQISWTAGDIVNSFTGWGWLPNFVFINACRSDSKNPSSEENRKQAWTIGDVFRGLRVPAVLTMQADINGEAAGIFAGALYKSLAALDPLDTAVAHARRAISNFIKGFDKREWAIPVLTIAIQPENILPLRPKAPIELLAKIKDCVAFEEIAYFSDRKPERRTLIQALYPLPPQTATKDLIIVRGEQEAGKSWLAMWCMEACALLNHDIRYVEVGGNESKTWLD